MGRRKGKNMLRDGGKVLRLMPDEFSAREFIDRWASCGTKLCPAVGAAWSIIGRLGCTKIGKQRGVQMFSKAEAFDND